MSDKIKESIVKYALQNAIFHEGKADSKAVLGRLLAEQPDLRKNIDQLRGWIDQAVRQINNLSSSEQYERLKASAPELLVKEAKEQAGLPELEKAVKGKVVTRFAPSPTGPLNLLHILRPVMLNYLYARKYKGRFVLRFDDTDASQIEKGFYKMIREDLMAVKAEWDQEVNQSDYMGFYYRHIEELINKGSSYICFCKAELFQDLKEKRQDCPCKPAGIEKSISSWERMQAREITKAVVRLKGSMQDPNPVLRDPPLMRVLTDKHPLKANRYHLWPLYNFASVVSDKYIGTTHIFRGKEHENNTNVQKKIYEALGWEIPVIMNFGMLWLKDFRLHTSEIKEKIKDGEFEGWNDLRLPTVRSLIRRGFRPEAFVQAAVETGLTKTDVQFSFEKLETINRRLLDPEADRFMVVTDPVKLSVKTSIKLKHVYQPFHPDFPERGKKEIHVNFKKIYISRQDFEKLNNTEFRLKGLGNIKISGSDAVYTGSKLVKEMPKIQWVSDPKADVRIFYPGREAPGYGEPALKKQKAGSIIQMERIGFGKIESTGEVIKVVFSHK